MVRLKGMMIHSALVALSLVMWAPHAHGLDVGDKAPDFELDSTQGGKLKLSSLQGKKNVLIQFYVLDFTPT